MLRLVMSGRSTDFSYPRNVHFQCTRCTTCCGDIGKRKRHVLMLKAEARRISASTSQPISAFASRIEGAMPYVYEMRKNENNKCVFLSQLSCTVYACRPLVCRFYPFELKPDGKGAHVFSYTKECSGIGGGRRLTRKHFEMLLEHAKKQMR